MGRQEVRNKRKELMRKGLSAKQYEDLCGAVKRETLAVALDEAIHRISNGYVRHLTTVMRENKISEERVLKIVTETNRRVFKDEGLSNE